MNSVHFAQKSLCNSWKALRRATCQKTCRRGQLGVLAVAPLTPFMGGMGKDFVWPVAPVFCGFGPSFPGAGKEQQAIQFLGSGTSR